MRALLLAGLILAGVACTATTEATPRAANQASQEAADRFCADLLSEPLAPDVDVMGLFGDSRWAAADALGLVVAACLDFAKP